MYTHRWISRLGTILSEHGFEKVLVDRNDLSDRYRVHWNQLYLMTLEEHNAKLKTSDPKRFEEGVAHLIKLREESSQGASVDIPYLTIVGKMGF